MTMKAAPKRSTGAPKAATSVLRVGLTGGIATGKSVVAEVFRGKGALVLDMDALGHSLMAPGSEAHREIREVFGDQILARGGEIDRKKLGEAIFEDPAMRLRLNGILHPRILAEERRLIAEFARKSPGGIVVTQAALLVEAGVQDAYDRLVVTHCGREDQLLRLQMRDGLSEQEALSRLEAQGEPRRKLEEADYDIDTGGNLEETRDRAREVYACLRRDQQSRTASD